MPVALDAAKKSLRKAGLYALAKANLGDGTIKHHYTGDKIRLHLFRHKGYWYHGRRREQAVMAAFGQLIRPGDCVIEAGGHIGYISLYFAELAGAGGSVHVFEPGANNLPYVRANAERKANITVVDKALGSECGELVMHVEDLTGQNNSLVADFAGLSHNQDNAIKATVTQQLVQVTTVDTYVGAHSIVPDFIKIDVEGFEWEVLSGAAGVLRDHRPALMVEVQSHRFEIADMLHSLDYRLYDENGRPVTEIPASTINIFAIPPGKTFPTFRGDRST